MRWHRGAVTGSWTPPPRASAACVPIPSSAGCLSAAIDEGPGSHIPRMGCRPGAARIAGASAASAFARLAGRRVAQAARRGFRCSHAPRGTGRLSRHLLIAAALRRGRRAMAVGMPRILYLVSQGLQLPNTGPSAREYTRSGILPRCATSPASWHHTETLLTRRGRRAYARRMTAPRFESGSSRDEWRIKALEDTVRRLWAMFCLVCFVIAARR